MNYAGFKQEIVKRINSLSGKYAPYSIFTDWVAMYAISIHNQSGICRNALAGKREKQYMEAAGKYSRSEMQEIAEMSGLLVMALEAEMRDVLGEIYMESGCGSRHTGQFFTPSHLSGLCAQLAVPDNINIDSPLLINEPSSGGGGTIIAAAKVLHEKGMNYQRCMRVVAQDLDWKGVYMTYIQLSLLGIKARVVQGDTLREPYQQGYPEERVFLTPAEMGAAP